MNKFEERKLREYIRTKLESLRSEKFDESKKTSKVEDLIREKVRDLLKEAARGVHNTSARSTGINVLASTLKQVIPIIEQAYKLLTTSHGQRKSFRAHIIQNAINTLMKVDIMNSEKSQESFSEEEQAPFKEPSNPEIGPEDELAMAVSDEDEEEGEEAAPAPLKEAADMDIDVDPGNEIPDLDPGESKFIDIAEKPKGNSKKASDPNDIPFVKIPTLDQTGMEMAQRTFPKIQKQLGDAYSILSNGEDRNGFADYLVANLKLYFDQFDQESSPEIPEPQSDQYDQIKQRTAQLSGIQENLVFTRLMKMLRG
jgi:hypothetical protein